MIIQSKRVWVCEQFMAAQIEYDKDKITGIYPWGTKECDLDFGEKRILPGFIDIHTHGAYGYDTNDADPDGLRIWMKQIPQEGVTAILPTTVTQMPEVLKEAVASVARVIDEGYEGAEILGVHFEGPYLDRNFKGAQPPEAIAEPSVEQFMEYQNAAKGLIRYITLSPEHDSDYALIRYCVTHGVTVSMGHSSATYEQAVLAAAYGASSMTHVYNGMTQLGSRTPGLVGAAMRLRGLYGEIIGDGCHSHLASLNIFYQNKGKDRAILVSDSLRVKYAPAGGHYQLGGHDIEVGEDGLARLSGTTTIAGSTLKINEGLRNLIEKAMIPVESAINSCTINPARCLHVDDRKGLLAVGYDADYVVLEDDYSVIRTVGRGKILYDLQGENNR